MTRSFSYDAFLCYSSSDRQNVETLALRLHDEDIKVFYDQWSLIPGRPWQEQLEVGLDQSRTCAVFVGPGQLGPWQTEEMRVALDQRVRDEPRAVMPVLLPGSDVDALPPFLKALHAIDLRSGLDGEAALRRLMAGIHGQSPGPPAAPG